MQYAKIRRGLILTVFVLITATAFAEDNPELIGIIDGTYKPIPPIEGKAIDSDKSQNPSETRKNEPTQPQSPVNVIVSGSLNVHSENTDKKADPESGKWSDPMTLVTLMLVAVGGAQVGLFYVQLKIIRESLVDAKTAADAAKQGAEAAKESADATKDIVATLQDNARKQSRAHVFIENSGIIDESGFPTRMPIRQNQPWISYAIKNSGFTPARKLIHWGMATILDITNEDTLVVPPLENIHQIILPPGGTSLKNFWFGRPLTTEEIADINIFRKAIYIFGAIRYEDVFGKTHTATYRMKYSGLYPPMGSGSFSFCEKGNDEEGE